MRKSPVILLGFNRPDLTRQVMDAIRRYQPSRLYLACDGPRHTHPGDAALVELVRAEMAQVDWPCTTFKLFRNENLGLQEAVVSALDWFFENEDEGIVLEDDCIPSNDFFRFSDYFLNEYRNESRVWGASGSNFTQSEIDGASSYGFVRIPLIWGWASWSRVWERYDRDLSSYKMLLGLRPSERWPSAELRHAFEWHLQDSLATGPKTWDYQLSWSSIHEGGLWGIPRSNLVSNRGFRDDATHTRGNPIGFHGHTELGEIISASDVALDERLEIDVLRKSGQILTPLWLNYFREAVRDTIQSSKSLHIEKPER